MMLFHIIAAALTFLSLHSTTTGALTPVNLKTSGDYAILSAGAVTIFDSKVAGDIASNIQTGLDLTLFPDGSYSTCSNVEGKVYALSYNSSTPLKVTQALKDMEAAYDDAVSRENPDFLNIHGGDLFSVTLGPGLYKWVGAVTVKGNLTIDGTSSDIFIFQIDGALTFNHRSRVILLNGALPQNIIWQVSGATLLDVHSGACGVILGQGAITMHSKSELCGGKALSQGAITLTDAIISG